MTISINRKLEKLSQFEQDASNADMMRLKKKGSCSL